MSIVINTPKSLGEVLMGAHLRRFDHVVTTKLACSQCAVMRISIILPCWANLRYLFAKYVTFRTFSSVVCEMQNLGMGA
jgi:hypothetical protein